jgi:hypothetical protein
MIVSLSPRPLKATNACLLLKLLGPARRDGKLGIRRVLTHSEKAAAYMADGYARISRRPGICMAQSVGAANGIWASRSIPAFHP